MKFDDYNRMTEEEKKEWLGNKELRFKVQGGQVLVWRYDPSRPLTEHEIEARNRFSRAASSLRGTKGKTKRKGVRLPKISIKLGEKLKIKKRGKIR